ncbi:MAG: large conductance mechanosensitive channel protein MscL [Ruminococcaceae bacterium]|nr:large conductance mechanosensitive channel protein MscL [Oscillospiraceae bacterium]
MKGFISEFKKFIMRGNVIDLAVGVIIGGAFQAIVNSLVNDVVSPVISLATKGINFADKFILLSSTDEIFATAEAAKEAGYATLNYGAFITAVINFIIMASVIFLLVKGINKVSELGKKKEEPAETAPTTKICPFCKSEISIEAVKCPNCTSDLPAEEAAE